MAPDRPEAVPLEDTYHEAEDMEEGFDDSEVPVPVMETPRQLMTLEEALKQIPESLKSEMKDLLRADFREVRRLKRKPRG